jgi:hypothetical protein
LIDQLINGSCLRIKKRAACIGGIQIEKEKRMKMKVKMGKGMLQEERIRRMMLNQGEHVYFEFNPGDPNLPRIMCNETHVTLDEHTWPGGWLESTAKELTDGGRQATREEIERIISDAIPMSRRFSQTHKIVVASFIPCPCCPKISLIVRVKCQGLVLGSEKDKVEGWYRLDISAMRGGQFEVEARRIIFEETSFFKKLF